MRAAYVAAAVLVLAGCTSGREPADPTPSTAGAPTLEWRPVDGSVDATVTRSSDWTLTVAPDGRTWDLAGPSGASDGKGDRQRVSDALLDDHRRHLGAGRRPGGPRDRPGRPLLPGRGRPRQPGLHRHLVRPEAPRLQH